MRAFLGHWPLGEERHHVGRIFIVIEDTPENRACGRVLRSQTNELVSAP